ncbi:phage tail protein [Thiohalocapsa sp. ML1]|jgi:phage tail-like protein|uniref:phage tail protein n=1 Tax=Thiohalocapsa sp. ML1 TaxID=1431688 RepID=UPI00073236AF|nr:phage tail protein [Thiohalocapsa sp. ML1]
MTELFIPFRFLVTLFSADKADGATAADTPEANRAESGGILCGGQFSEVTGLEVTMTPKTITEGGRNWGALQRSGPTSFSAVTLKRGVTTINDLWAWFDVTTRGANYGYRLRGEISVLGNPRGGGEPAPVMTFKLTNVLPVKFKGPDLSATANQVAIEELQLVHEGLELVRPGG